MSRSRNLRASSGRPTVVAKSGKGLELSISLSVCACLASDLLQVLN